MTEMSISAEENRFFIKLNSVIYKISLIIMMS